MKNLLIIVFGILLSANSFAIEDPGWRDVQVTFTNQQGPSNAHPVVVANYPGNGYIIPWEWFFESITWTRVITGQVQWVRSGKVIAVQNFSQVVDYSDIYNKSKELLHINVELDRIEYYHNLDFDK